MNSGDIINLIKNDHSKMKVLTIVKEMKLPNWLIGAGFVRNKVWDYLSGYTKNTPPTDIDVAYFDPDNTFVDSEVELKLSRLIPGIKWEVVNQANAHEMNGDKPYTSISDAISKWPETATAVGITMFEDSRLELIAPLGIDDLVNMIVCPTPHFSLSNEKKQIVKNRIVNKKWLQKWPRLSLHINNDT